MSRAFCAKASHAVTATLAAAFASSILQLRAQENDDLPTEHVAIIPPGGMVDLASGLILHGRELRTFKADLRFDRDGAGFYLEPLIGGQRAGPDAVAPTGNWLTGHMRVDGNGSGPIVMFVRTDRGVARVEVELLVAASSAMLRWAVVPPTQPVFLPPPDEVVTGWAKQQLEVSWQGDYPRFLIEVHSDGKLRKETTAEHRIAIDGLDVQGRHRVIVRGITATNEVTLPAEVVQHGPRRAPERGVIEFAQRWYERTGGLKLSTGAIATEDAEVVCYLYGVSMPGGGLQKMGSGGTDYAALSDLPALGYVPGHGRLDAGDVFAVRLADGRYGKLWVEAPNGQLYDGMNVHFTFLADGRRRLLRPPSEVVAVATAGSVELRWRPSPSAVSYRVSAAGRAPVTVPGTLAVLKGLEALTGQVISCQLVAIDAAGEESDSTTVSALLQDAQGKARFGRCTLQAQRGGFVFATESPAADGKDSDLALVGGAGMAEVLDFSAKGGAARSGAIPFGQFPDPGTLTFQKEFASNVREKDHDRFFVRTADGGMAAVRIIERGWPQTVVEYVWMPKQ